jgi:c-di-GMP-related signal transduction protein
VFVARQPILDRAQRPLADDLLFRPSPENGLAQDEADDTSRSGIGHSLTTFALDDLTQGRRAHLRFSRWLLVDQTPRVLPPDKVVVEIAASRPADEEVLQAMPCP